MAGALPQRPAGALPQRPAGPATGAATATSTAMTASYMNSFLISTVAERLGAYLRPGQRPDRADFFNLCLSLARGIDYAVANNEVPAMAQELPLLVKQVYLRKTDFLFQAAIMVLMISVKSACKIGWFLAKDTDDLLNLANEIGSCFGGIGDFSTEPSHSLPTVSIIMSRFYPQIKMGWILGSLEVKPGYGVFVVDFNIQKSMVSSAREKIHLFVAQTDNTETSSCIISPPQVNFLLNGKAVDKRTNISMDNGPQFPTNLTGFLKYGTNVLQLVGQFNGNYIVIIAFMSLVSSPDPPVLPDHVQPVAAASDSDSDIIEGPSRISLNCPISYTRIRTPVKGSLCKHHQCFDYGNFMEINLRRPSWRCPHCNQSVCYTDMRIDKYMVKVLKEVGDDVSDVIISADGSWKAVVERNDQFDKPCDKNRGFPQDGPRRCEPTGLSNTSANVVDLTERADDESDATGVYHTEDRKPFRDNMGAHSIAGMSVEANNTFDLFQTNASQLEEEFWSGTLMPTLSAAPNTGLDVQVFGGISVSPAANMLSPVLTDAISPALYQESMDVRSTPQVTAPLSQSQFSTPSNLQLQQSQFANSIVSNEYGRLPSIPRNVSRTPIAIQALPAQSQVPSVQQQSRASLNTFLSNCASHSSQALQSIASSVTENLNTASCDAERQRQFSRSTTNSIPVSNMASSMQHHSMTQRHDFQNGSYIQGQSAQQVVGLPAASQVPGAYRGSSRLPSQHQNPHHLQPPSPRMPQTMIQSPNSVRSSPNFQPMQGPQGGIQGSGGGQASSLPNHQARLLAGAQRTASMARSPSTMPVQNQASRMGSSLPTVGSGIRAPMGEHRGNTGGTPVSRADGLELTSEQNWQPTGRMRGSLSGRPYPAALSQLIIQPSQPAQAARPQFDPVSNSTASPQLQALMNNRVNARTAQSYPMMGDALNGYGTQQ